MVPFTYRFMPTNQFVKQLITDGYVGRPYHLSMRYFAGYARDGAYAWRFDEEKAGSGILGDLGSHWLDMARWFLGEVTEVSGAHRLLRRPRAAPGRKQLHASRRQRSDPCPLRVRCIGDVGGACRVLGRNAVRADPRARSARQ